MTTALDRLADLGLELPAAPAALAAYVPTRLVPVGGGTSLLFIAGQIPIENGQLRYLGRVPDQVSFEDARLAARLCALNILAQAQAAVGLDNVKQVAQLTGWVLSADGYGDQPLVLNAASDLLVEVLGESGRHTRAAVGASALPRSVSVEITAVLVVAEPPP